jgi:hypothetical protein
VANSESGSQAHLFQNCACEKKKKNLLDVLWKSEIRYLLRHAKLERRKHSFLFISVKDRVRLTDSSYFDDATFFKSITGWRVGDPL